MLTIYSDQRLDRNLFGWEMPVSWVQSINPVFIIILSGVFAAIWTRLGKRQPSTPVKFALAAIIMGSAFLLFLPFAGGGANSTPLLAIVGILFVFTVAELLISPVGLSVMNKLAPKRLEGFVMGIWFLAISIGFYIAGRAEAEVGKLAVKLDWGTGGLFYLIMIFAIVVGAILFAVAGPVKRMLAEGDLPVAQVKR